MKTIMSFLVAILLVGGHVYSGCDSGTVSSIRSRDTPSDEAYRLTYHLVNDFVNKEGEVELSNSDRTYMANLIDIYNDQGYKGLDQEVTYQDSKMTVSEALRAGITPESENVQTAEGTGIPQHDSSDTSSSSSSSSASSSSYTRPPTNRVWFTDLKKLPVGGKSWFKGK